MPQPRQPGRSGDRSFMPRDPVDGSSRVRIRFRREVVSLIEEAAGDNDPVKWIEETVEREALKEVRERRRRRRIPRNQP